MSERWTIHRCPVHGGLVSERRPCREVVERTETHVRYCHMSEPVEVVPAADLRSVGAELKALVAECVMRGAEAGDRQHRAPNIAKREAESARRAAYSDIGDRLRAIAAALPGQEEQ